VFNPFFTENFKNISYSLCDLFVVQLLDEGEEKVIRLTEPELRKVIGDHLVSLLKQKKVQCYPLDNIMVAFTQHYGYTIPMEDLHVYSMEQLMAKLKHVLKVYHLCIISSITFDIEILTPKKVFIF
jgi:hypothetical protein